MRSIELSVAAVEAFDALDAALDRVDALVLDALTSAQRLEMLSRTETVRRRLPNRGHELINALGAQASREELGGKLSHALADRLRISRAEASRRIHEAEDLGPRRAFTGERLIPHLGATAAGQAAGMVGGEHVAVIRGFAHRLPDWVDAATREQAEAQLVQLASDYRPEQVRKAADLIAQLLNPDGTFSDADRARARGITFGPQDPDGMSPIRGMLTPELRAGLDAILAKWAAPGMCNPADQTPTVKGTPCQQAIQGDTRSGAQRAHDGLAMIVRAALMSKTLGSHKGLPVSIIATVSLQDLQAKAGFAVTGGGTLLPMSDVIRLARHAYHYLYIFDKHTARPLYLGKSQRLPSADQRIVLHATDRGCSFPGCDVPGYLAEVHHVTDWRHGGRTDIDHLAFGCGCHHEYATSLGWLTRKKPDGNTAWIPPPEFDHGQPRTNTYFHPEKLLHPDEAGDNSESEQSSSESNGGNDAA